MQQSGFELMLRLTSGLTACKLTFGLHFTWI